VRLKGDNVRITSAALQFLVTQGVTAAVTASRVIIVSILLSHIFC
jgi:hypothetical protein